MTSTQPVLMPSPARLSALPGRRARLSATAAFYLQASIIVSFLAGSIAPTPLYGVYQAAWGFSPITITVVFGIYAVADSRVLRGRVTAAASGNDGIEVMGSPSTDPQPDRSV